MSDIKWVNILPTLLFLYLIGKYKKNNDLKNCNLNYNRNIIWFYDLAYVSVLTITVFNLQNKISEYAILIVCIVLNTAFHSKMGLTYNRVTLFDLWRLYKVSVYATAAG